MKKVRVYFSLGVLFLGSFVFYASANVVAVPSFKLTLSPILENIVIKKGSSYKGSTEIINQGSNTIYYSVYPTPYGVTNENYDPAFIPLAGKPDITSWFNISDSKGVLAPGKLSSINYTINVPGSTLPGGYYAAIFAQSNQGSGSTKGNIIQASYRVGELFYIDVPGPVKKSGSVYSWSSSWLQSNEIKATVKLENRGSLHFLSSVRVNFTSLFGGSNYSATLTRFVLPQTIRKIDVAWNKPPSFGLYRISGTATTTKTDQLHNRYVLVISNGVKVKAAIALGLVVLIILLDSTLSTIIERVNRLWKRIVK